MKRTLSIIKVGLLLAAVLFNQNVVAVNFPQNFETVEVQINGYPQAMQLVGTNTWQTETAAPHSNTGHEILFQADNINFGDLNNDGHLIEGEPAAQQTLPSSRYLITLNDDEMTYRITRLFESPSIYQRNFESIFALPGGFGISGMHNMELIGDHLWQSTFNVSGDQTVDADFLFEMHQFQHVTPYGDETGSGTAQAHSLPRTMQLHPGNYLVTLNDQDFSYTIIRTFENGMGFDRNYETIKLGITNHTVEDMTLVSEHRWQIKVDFDQYAENQIHFFAQPNQVDTIQFGDLEDDGAAEITSRAIHATLSPGSYIITFEDDTRNYYIDQTFETWLAYARNVESLSFSHNVQTDLSLVQNHIWQGTIYVSEPVTPDAIFFRANAYTATEHQYGDALADGTAERDTSAIPITLTTGHYRVTFNDETLNYSIEARNVNDPMFITDNTYAEINITGHGPTTTQALMPIADGIWEGELYIDGPADDHEIWFLIDDGAGNQNGSLYGDSNGDGILSTNENRFQYSLQPGRYVINFDESNYRYRIIRKSNRGTPFAHHYQSVGTTMRGPDNKFTELELVDDHVWHGQLTIDFHETAVYETRFNIGIQYENGTDFASYGDDNNDGIAEPSQADFLKTLTPGDYIITYNELSDAYSIIQETNAVLPFQHFYRTIHIHADAAYAYSQFVGEMKLIDNHIWQGYIDYEEVPEGAISANLHTNRDLNDANFIFGDAQNDGIANPWENFVIHDTAPGSYVFTFNELDNTYSIERRLREKQPFARYLDLLRFNANFAGPNDQMTLVADHTWQAIFDTDAQPGQPPLEYLFGAESRFPNHTQYTQYSDLNNDGLAENVTGQAQQASMPLNIGTYIVTIDDRTMEYSIERLFKENKAFNRNNEWASIRTSYGEQYMALVDNHTWQIQLAIDDTPSGFQDIQFVTGNELIEVTHFTYYADTDGDGVAEDVTGSGQFGQHALSAGTYVFTFNETDLSYTITAGSDAGFDTLQVDIPGHAKQAMKHVGNSTWETIVYINTSNQNQTLEFTANHLEINHNETYGDIEYDGIADLNGPAIPTNLVPGHYVVRFNEQSRAYSIANHFVTPQEFDRHFEDLNVSIGGEIQAMSLVTDHIWTIDVELEGSNDFNFIANNTTAFPVNYGDDAPADFFAEPSDTAIAYNKERGTYRILFDDRNLRYEITLIRSIDYLDIQFNTTPHNQISANQSLTTTVTVDSLETDTINRDLWIAIQLPPAPGETEGQYVFYQPNGEVSQNVTPMLSCIPIQGGTRLLDAVPVINNYTFNEEEQGIYHWLIVFTHCGAHPSTGTYGVETIEVGPPR